MVKTSFHFLTINKSNHAKNKPNYFNFCRAPYGVSQESTNLQKTIDSHNYRNFTIDRTSLSLWTLRKNAIILSRSSHELQDSRALLLVSGPSGKQLCARSLSPSLHPFPFHLSFPFFNTPELSVQSTRNESIVWWMTNFNVKWKVTRKKECPWDRITVGA